MPGTPHNAIAQGAMRIVRFPPLRSAVIWVLQDEGAWLVLVGSNGWLHGDQNSAITDAQRLAENYGLPIRNIGQQRPPRPP
jgi:hypothetical protein